MTHLARFTLLATSVAGFQTLEAKRVSPRDKQVAQQQQAAVLGTWQAAAAMADKGESTTAQRAAMEARIEATKSDLSGMVKEGLASPESAAIITNELDLIWKDITRKPPTDPQVTCYRMMFNPPGRVALARLSSRLPLLEAAIKAGKLDAEVGALAAKAVEADLAELAKPEATQPLTPEEKTKAVELSEQARKLIAAANQRSQ